MMNSEEARLRTWDDVLVWDSSPWTMEQKRELARNGFFATGIFTEAQCAWCHCTLSDWLQHTPIDERHKLLRPDCPFIVNYSNSGNIPINANEFIQQQQQASVTPTAPLPEQQQRSEADGVDLFVEANRLATFKNWPNPNISPQSLAKAGFYYLNRSDMVQCAWCKGVIAKWEKEDIAFEEHRRFFPDCPKVQLGPLIEIASDGIRDLGIQQITAPKRPKYSSLDARLRTYTEWPIRDIQQPEALAQAGLYYQNVDDQVRCFHCNIGLRSWQKEDDPWFEHAKWYPQCSFVQLVKGVAYVQQVQEIVRQNGGTTEEPHAPVCPPKISIDEAMSTIPVKQALEMGIDAGCIRNATQRRLCATGKPYSTVEDLLKAIFDDRIESEEAALNESQAEAPIVENGGSLVREVSRLLYSLLGPSNEENANGNENLNPTTTSNTVIAPSIGNIGTTINAANEAGASASCSNRLNAYEPQSVLLSSLPTAANNATDSTGNTKVSTSANLHTTGTTTAMVDVAAVAAVAEEKRVETKNSSHENGMPLTRCLSLEEEVRKLKDARLCKVCLDEDVAVVFLPCGHLVTCVQCAPGVTQCPMCRADIRGFVRTYLS